jgi:hypothetical protein
MINEQMNFVASVKIYYRLSPVQHFEEVQMIEAHFHSNNEKFEANIKYSQVLLGFYT